MVRLTRQQLPLHNDGGVVQFKSAYHGRISVGRPTPQIMDVVFDTGSGHLVLPSALCKSKTCLRHVRYRRKSSGSAVDIDSDGTQVMPGQPRDQLTVSYGTGEITGIFVRDHVCLGNRLPTEPEPEPVHADKQPSTADKHPVQASSLLQTKVQQMAQANASELREDEYDEDQGNHGCSSVQLVAAMEMTENPFSSFAFDGVLGLGLVGLSQTPSFNFFDVAAQSASWDPMPGFEKAFSVFLGTSKEEDSTITFGGYQPQALAEGSDFAWHVVRDPLDGYWQITLFGITVNGKRLDFCDDGTCRAVVDTGTSLLTVPSIIGPRLVNMLRYQNEPGYQCDGPGPILELDLGNVTVVLEPRDIHRPEFIASKAADGTVREIPADKVDNCVPMLMHLDLPEPLSKKTFILGEPVLQKYLAAFNMDPINPSVGFATAKHTGERDRLSIAA